jgi:hypothetical protein
MQANKCESLKELALVTRKVSVDKLIYTGREKKQQNMSTICKRYSQTEHNMHKGIWIRQQALYIFYDNELYLNLRITYKV